MVTAIILINAARNKIPETTQALAGLPGVSEVYSVAGPYDIAVIIRVRENQELADLVTKKMLKVDGIEKSTTLIAFEVVSKFDLERMFSLGLEK
jgi:DNA-binding Lrp family transcriptional regulator